MLAQPPLWFIALAFIAALGPLVFIHELGHYLVARWCGVGAETFSIGFGREVAGWTDKRGTRWKVGWLPLGGYVKFVGDMSATSQGVDPDDIAPRDRSRAFHLKPVWKRFLIVLAGPMANFLLAIVIVSALFAVDGVPRTSNVAIAIQPGSPAAAAGIASGDRIVAVADRTTDSFEDVFAVVILRPDEAVRVEVERAGKLLSLPVTIAAEEQRDRFGQTFRIGRLGVMSGPPQMVRVPASELVPEATRYTIVSTGRMIDGLWQIISGRRTIKDLGGPLKMAQIAGQVATLGLREFIELIALFSINLGFINLLPIPMLDGGHLLFYGAEAIRRRPVSARAQEWAFRGGLAVLLTFVVMVTVNDLASFGLFDQLGRLIG
ncbi:MAG: M50 family metallopeptidase [Pseudomonadota bacterium]|nr:M50 family metallopeptidase [Pseudomonadota bacterium]